MPAVAQEDGSAQRRSSFVAALAALFASTGTLVCCALPALLVALGAGAALSSLVSAVPQLVWVSEHKDLVFTFAAVMLATAGALQWLNRSAPCPTDPALRNACLRTRSLSRRVYVASVALFAIGAWFAFAAPWLAQR
jgi:ribose/xylose/arabinose/galactoside ABC-type transport system permease subunit